jgi:iron complex transport system substrate-binding protein
LLCACNNKKNSAETACCASDSAQYATGFSISKSKEYIIVNVHDPWNKDRLLQRYILVSRNSPLPENLPKGTVIKVPVKNVIVYSSVHCAMLAELDATDCISGVCDYEYIRLNIIKTLYELGKIKNMGEAISPNIEKIIDSGAEAIIATPFENGSYGSVEKIGIPVIECADYMENTPLGRAEWIQFIGLLTCKTEKADSLFRQTENNYLKTKLLTKDLKNRPTLLVGMKYGTPWYVPSGESFMAQIFKDAGADYIFKYLPGTGGTPLSFETVLDKAVHADFWLIQYNNAREFTYELLKADFSSYNQFDAFKNRQIFGCNTHYSMYYEEMPVHPDCLLAELIAIFHPQFISNHRFRYFSPLK